MKKWNVNQLMLCILLSVLVVSVSSCGKKNEESTTTTPSKSFWPNVNL